MPLLLHSTRERGNIKLNIMAYVYRHIRLDKNEPFYIGIGKTKYRHTAKQNRNDIWEKIAAKTEYDVEILFEDVDWDFACKKEIELIKLYGRINRGTGTLANMTDGGDGNLGLVHSAEALRKISESSKLRPGHWKGKKMSKDFCDKLSKSKLGKPNFKTRGKPIPESTKEAVRKHSYGNKYHLGKKHTDESKRKMSERMKGREGANRLGVSQYSLDGKYIKSFISLMAAEKETGSYDVHTVCKGKRKSSNGYMWRYEKFIDGIAPLKYNSVGWDARLKKQ